MLSLQDYRNYRQNRGKRAYTLAHFVHIQILMSCIAKYAENDFSLLRSKIRELHPVQRASLGALLRHLLQVGSHSARNSVTVKALAAQFSHPLLRGSAVVQGGVDTKARCIDLL